MNRTPRILARVLFAAATASLAAGCASGTALPERRPGSDTGRADVGGRPDVDDLSDIGSPDTDTADATSNDAGGDDAGTTDVGAADVSDTTVDDADAAPTDAGDDTTVAPDAADDATADTSTADTTAPDAAADVTDTTPDADATVVDAGTECFEGTTEPCYGGDASRAGVGVCSRGERTCVGGRWGTCVGWVAPAAAETCGNSLDDNCSGAVDEGCPTACGVRPTRLISNVENDNIHALFQAAGLSIVEPFSINNTHFAGSDVLLVNALYMSSTATPAVIRDFLNRGGSVVVLTTSLQTSCTRIHNDNLAGTGLGLRCSSSSPAGPVTSLGSHPLTAGLSAGQFPAPYASEVVGGTALALIGSTPVAAALEEGCGRMIVVGGSDVADDYYWPVQRAFWQNVVSWTATPR